MEIDLFQLTQGEFLSWRWICSSLSRGNSLMEIDLFQNPQRSNSFMEILVYLFQLPWWLGEELSMKNNKPRGRRTGEKGKGRKKYDKVCKKWGR
jgi:hypothetical protein